MNYQALNHPYLEQIRDQEEEIEFMGKLDFAFETEEKLSLDELKRLILEEVNIFRVQKNEQ